MTVSRDDMSAIVGFVDAVRGRCLNLFLGALVLRGGDVRDYLRAMRLLLDWRNMIRAFSSSVSKFEVMLWTGVVGA